MADLAVPLTTPAETPAAQASASPAPATPTADTSSAAPASTQAQPATESQKSSPPSLSESLSSALGEPADKTDGPSPTPPAQEGKDQPGQTPAPGSVEAGKDEGAPAPGRQQAKPGTADQDPEVAELLKPVAGDSPRVAERIQKLGSKLAERGEELRQRQPLVDQSMKFYEWQQTHGISPQDLATHLDVLGDFHKGMAGDTAALERVEKVLTDSLGRVSVALGRPPAKATLTIENILSDFPDLVEKVKTLGLDEGDALAIAQSRMRTARAEGQLQETRQTQAIHTEIAQVQGQVQAWSKDMRTRDPDANWKLAQIVDMVNDGVWNGQPMPVILEGMKKVYARLKAPPRGAQNWGSRDLAPGLQGAVLPSPPPRPSTLGAALAGALPD